MSKEKIFSATVILAALLFTTTADALLMSSDDLWDVSNGTVVTGNSRINDTSNASNMFGGSGGSPESTNTIFYDETTGFLHWIEWQTAAPVTITSFNLVAAHDESPRDARTRGFSRFSLYAKSGDDWINLYNYYPANPYGGGTNYLPTNFLELNDNVAETTAQKFRAEFVQYGDITAGAKGPRILELDGYSIPEPATLVILTCGVFAVRRMKKS